MEVNKEQNIPRSFKSFLIKNLDRATNAVGILTILSTIAIFGLSMLVFGLNYSTWITVLYFGISGTCEVFHIQKKSDLYKRMQTISDSDDLIHNIASAKRVGDPKIIEQIKYAGFLFNAIGFEKLPISVGISRPLCPKCNRPVVMDAKVKFPGRIKIKYFCICGYEKFSDKTENELRDQVARGLNAPS